MALRPAYKPKIVKKRTKKFIRHQSDRYDKLAVSIPMRFGAFPKGFVYKNRLCLHRKVAVYWPIPSSHCSPTGVSRKVLITECAVASRVSTWCPTSVTDRTSAPAICCPTDSRSSWSTTSASWRCWWCRTVSTAPKSPTPCRPRSASRLSSAPSSWPSPWRTRTAVCARRRTSKLLLSGGSSLYLCEDCVTDGAQTYRKLGVWNHLSL